MFKPNYKLVILTIIYFIILFIYQKPKNYLLLNSKIDQLNKFTIDYFKNNYGNHDILVTYSPSNAIDMDTKYYPMKLSEYLDNYLNYSDYYFKTEDQYNFLHQIDLDSFFLNTCRQSFKHWFILNDRISFWLGGPGTTTSFHLDKEDISYLYIIEGSKKISLIEPKYSKYMYPYSTYYHYAIYSQVDFKNVDYYKFPLFAKVKMETIILTQGQSLLIPRNWWHAVENLESTLAISYKLYRPIFIFWGIFPELIRKYLSKKKGNNYIWNYYFN